MSDVAFGTLPCRDIKNRRGGTKVPPGEQSSVMSPSLARLFPSPIGIGSLPVSSYPGPEGRQVSARDGVLSCVHIFYAVMARRACMRLPGTKSRVTMAWIGSWPSGPLCATPARPRMDEEKNTLPQWGKTARKTNFLTEYSGTLVENGCPSIRNTCSQLLLNVPVAPSGPLGHGATRHIAYPGLRPGQTHSGALRHGATQPAPKPKMCPHNRTASRANTYAMGW